MRLKDEKSLTNKKAITYLLNLRENECTIVEVRTEKEVLYVIYEEIYSK